MVVAVGSSLLALLGSDDSGSQSPVLVPDSAESARVDELQMQFPGGDQVPAILVLTRDDGAALSPADLEAAEQARQQMAAATVQQRGAAGPRC